MFRANAIYEGALPARHLHRPAADRQAPDRDRRNETAPTPSPTAPPARATTRSASSSAYYHFNPAIKVIAPWRDWDLNSRQALIDYAKKNGIPIPTTKKRPWSSDRNLLHISFEGGILEDTWAEAPEDMYVLTKSPEKAPEQAAVRGDRIQERQCRGRGRRDDDAGPAPGAPQLPSAASTASAGSTCWRTARSA